MELDIVTVTEVSK